MDYLDFVLAALVTGLGLKAFWPFGAGKPAAVQSAVQSVQPTRTVVPDTVSGPDSDYARFHYADGRIEVKKFKSTDLSLEMEWKGRKFVAEKWTPAGEVYREVI